LSHPAVQNRTALDVFDVNVDHIVVPHRKESTDVVRDRNRRSYGLGVAAGAYRHVEVLHRTDWIHHGNVPAGAAPARLGSTTQVAA
jgi:hypothetical protein